mmetsp:Transcript_33976/g.41904  ORF Transcript_33976/g.41904 Transcript_33976/m.41904 type:complete len:408 (+) Transcript_33976:421-1644(+)
MGWNLYALPALLTPFAITWLICAIASAEHFINIKQASFQGVYIRALLIFPLTSCLAIIGGIDKSITPWMEVLIGMIEGYVLILFMGLYIGWGWTQGDVHKVLLDFERTKYPCYMCCRSWGSEITDGNRAVRSLRTKIYQYIIVRPSISLVDAIYYAVTGKSLGTGYALVLAAVRLVSVLIAIRALVTLYFALKKSNLLTGLKGFRKLSIIKALLFVVVLNSLLFNPLISRDIMKVPDYICSSEDLMLDATNCKVQLEAWIFVLEALVLIIIAAFVFRADDMDSLPKEYLKPTSRRRLFVHIFTLHDVVSSFIRRPKHCIYREQDEKDQTFAAQGSNIDLENGKGATSSECLARNSNAVTRKNQTPLGESHDPGCDNGKPGSTAEPCTRSTCDANIASRENDGSLKTA